MIFKLFGICLISTTASMLIAKDLHAASFRENIIEGNKEISRHIDNLAQEIDTLLSNRKGRPFNRSTISLLGFIDGKEGGEQVTTGHISADLRLPKFEKKWQLRFSSFDREDEFEGNFRNRDGAGAREQKYGTSIGLLKKIGQIRTLFRPRIELRDPLISSFLLKFESRFDATFFEVSWIKKFFTHSIDGVGQSLSVDFNRKLSDDLLFQLINEGQYLDKENLFRVAQGPSLRYRIDDLQAFAATFIFNSQNRSFISDLALKPLQAGSYHLNSYLLSVSYSQKLLKRIFHYQVSPYLEFSKTNAFKGEAGFRLRTEIIF